MNDNYIKETVKREENEKLLRSITIEMGKDLAVLAKAISSGNQGSAGIALGNLDIQFAMLKALDIKVNGKQADIKVA